MTKYLEIIKEFPEEMQSSLLKIIQAISEDIANTATKADFAELQKILSEILLIQKELIEAQKKIFQSIAELTEAQKRTDERVDQLFEAQKRTEESLRELTISVNQLAEAQKKTEERVDQLFEAQKRIEESLRELTISVNQLAEAQKRTEEGLRQLNISYNQLAEAQKITEEKIKELTSTMNELQKTVEKLAEDQRRTEAVLRALIIDHKKTRKMLGGLSDTVGFNLEDISYLGLPFLLKRDFSIEIKEGLSRQFLQYPSGKYEEVNIYGKGYKNNEEFFIIGECKSKMSKKRIDKFIKKLNRLQSRFGYKNIIPLLICYQASPSVRDYALSKNFKLYFSYEIRKSIPALLQLIQL